MQNKLCPIKYSIQNNNFKYHIRKAQLKKGSFVSKKIHPLEEVEACKNELIIKKRLKNHDFDYYVVRKTIIIGSLMAYNLYYGDIKNEFEIDDPIVVNSKDINLQQEFGIKNIHSIHSTIYNNMNRNAFKLKKISKVEMNYNFIKEHNPNKFMPIEEIIKNQLIKNSFITNNARHGISKDNECDIVDEKNNIQIEVITEFKNKLKKDKAPQKNVEMLIIECVDNNLIKTSAALLKKFTKKVYTDKYEKQLAIFCIGTNEAVGTMMEELSENLSKNNIKNIFTKIYILFYDLINEKYYWYPDKDNNIALVQDIEDRIAYKTEVKYYEMKDNEKYLLECKNIFNEEIMVAYLKKEEIIAFANKMKIII